MKNRDYKQFAPQEIHHVYNRGVNKTMLFKDSADFKFFLKRIEENIFPDKVDRKALSRIDRKRKMLPPNSFHLICYCLMPNHFHLVIQQLTELPISKLISKICTAYSMYFNGKYERVGALFQDQFKAAHIENNQQLLWTCFYVHKNPIEAKLCTDIHKYWWNSYLEYENEDTPSLCNKDILLSQFNSKDSFINHFNQSLKSEESFVNKIAGFHDVLIDF